MFRVLGQCTMRRRLTSFYFHRSQLGEKKCQFHREEKKFHRRGTPTRIDCTLPAINFSRPESPCVSNPIGCVLEKFTVKQTKTNRYVYNRNYPSAELYVMTSMNLFNKTKRGNSMYYQYMFLFTVTVKPSNNLNYLIKKKPLIILNDLMYYTQWTYSKWQQSSLLFKTVHGFYSNKSQSIV